MKADLFCLEQELLELILRRGLRDKVPLLLVQLKVHFVH